MTRRYEQTVDIQKVVVDAIRTEFHTTIREVLREHLSNSEDSNQKSEYSEYYISRKTAASRLALSTQTIDRLIKQGTLPASRVGRQVLIKETDLQQFIDSKAICTTKVVEVQL